VGEIPRGVFNGLGKISQDGKISPRTFGKKVALWKARPPPGS